LGRLLFRIRQDLFQVLQDTPARDLAGVEGEREARPEVLTILGKELVAALGAEVVVLIHP
jgi:hypothetical protein